VAVKNPTTRRIALVIAENKFKDKRFDVPALAYMCEIKFIARIGAAARLSAPFASTIFFRPVPLS
jgi:hypothetical protein